VQKYKAADDDEVYEAGGPKGARHTLFSGTQVLQAGAGGGSSTDVLAIVTATGTHYGSTASVGLSCN